MSEFVIQPAETLAIEYWKRLRLEPCFNTTSEDIPPFACMQKRRPFRNFSETRSQTKAEEVDQFFCQHLRRDQLMWDVFKCDAQGAARQDPAEFCFNGPFVIPKLSPGLCTSDYPCQVLHNGTIDSLPNFTACGPVEDQWYVLSGGSAWVCSSHDAASVAGGGKMHTVWIERSNGKAVSAHGRFIVTATDLDTGEYFSLGGSSLVKSLEYSTPWLITSRDGLYLVSFRGKLTSSDASRGDELSITLYKKKADDEDGTEHQPETTPYITDRNMDIEQLDGGSDAQRTAESVSFSGIENLRNGDGIALKNTSGKKLTLGNGILTMAAIGSYFDESGSSGFGPDS